MIMPKKKIKKSKKSSLFIVAYKFTIYSTLVSLLIIFLVIIATPIVSNTATVLGTSTFLAMENGEHVVSHEEKLKEEERKLSHEEKIQKKKEELEIKLASKREELKKKEEELRKKAEEIRLKREKLGSEVELKEKEASANAELKKLNKLKDKINIKSKDDRLIDITSEKVKTKLEFEKNKTSLVAEVNDDGREIELEEDEVQEVEDRLEESGVTIEPDNDFAVSFESNKTKAVTDLPVSFDLSTNTLIVETKDGQQPINVLPDKAVETAVENKEITSIVKEEGPSGQIERVTAPVELREEDGKPVYRMKGLSSQKLFGIMPVLIERTVDVSAGTGEIEKTNTPIFDRLIDFLSN